MTRPKSVRLTRTVLRTPSGRYKDVRTGKRLTPTEAGRRLRIATYTRSRERYIGKPTKHPGGPGTFKFDLRLQPETVIRKIPRAVRAALKRGETVFRVSVTASVRPNRHEPLYGERTILFWYSDEPDEDDALERFDAKYPASWGHSVASDEVTGEDL